MDFLIVGNGMFGAAAARYLAPHASVTAIGPPSSSDGIRDYGAHHDEGRIIGDFSRDAVRSELNRLARAGITSLDPDLIVRCGVLTATASNSADLTVAARLREQHGTDISVLTSGEATARYPMTAFGSGEAVLSQPDAGYFSPRRYVALCLQSARSRGATVIPGGFVRDLRPHLFVSGDRTPLRRKCMFACSDRTLLVADCESLTLADILPLIGAEEPQPQTAVTFAKHLSPSGPLNAVETGK